MDDLVIPNVLEVTFLNKKYAKNKSQIKDLPNLLDKKNVEKKKILNYLIIGLNESNKKIFLQTL